MPMDEQATSNTWRPEGVLVLLVKRSVNLAAVVGHYIVDFHRRDAQGQTQTKDLFDALIYSYGVKYLSLPAGLVPVDPVDGLPAGVQIIGRRFREDLILDEMEAIERDAGVMAHRLWANEAPV